MLKGVTYPLIYCKFIGTVVQCVPFIIKMIKIQFSCGMLMLYRYKLFIFAVYKEIDSNIFSSSLYLLNMAIYINLDIGWGSAPLLLRF